MCCVNLWVVFQILQRLPFLLKREAEDLIIDRRKMTVYLNKIFDFIFAIDCKFIKMSYIAEELLFVRCSSIYLYYL